MRPFVDRRVYISKQMTVIVMLNGNRITVHISRPNYFVWFSLRTSQVLVFSIHFFPSVVVPEQVKT